MTARSRNVLAGAIACAALAPSPSAAAGVVLSVDGHKVVRTTDPFVPGPADSGLAPVPRRARRPTASAGARASSARGAASKPVKRRKRSRGPTRGEKAVGRALTGARRARRISRGASRRYRRLYDRARATRKRLRGARGRELGSVIATLEGIALRRGLDSSRMKPLFLILRRNLEYWPRRPFPPNRAQVTFRGSELVFQYYRGSGLQLQPLVNAKKANLMHGACVKSTGRPCLPANLRRLASELTGISSRRGGFRAWEYYFSFGGGRPPWVSGMAQATAIQGLARASQLLRDPRYVRTAYEALGAFEQPPPTGVAALGPLAGTHYLQYSFAPRLFIFNAFLQALIGLYDLAEITGDTRARRLFAMAEPEAAAELPLSDTGDWSRYSFGGRESTHEYHELLRELAASMCSRIRAPVYCQTARSFRSYANDPAELVLLGPSMVTQGVATNVSFTVSKLSAVQLTITRDGAPALDKLIRTVRRGSASVRWTPAAAGTYGVRVAAKELRTGRELRSQTIGQVVSLPGP